MSYANSSNPQAEEGGAQKLTGFLSHVRNSSQRPVLGIGLSLHSMTVAQVAAISGAEFVFIDMEHSPLSAENATRIVHTVSATSRGSCYPIVRVPSHGVEWIKWALDGGAAGIIIPMVDDIQQINGIIDRAVYPPAGRRSFGPFNAPYAAPEGPGTGVPGYLERAYRRDIAILPMVESLAGLANVEEIAAHKEVSGIFIGPWDLRLALGLPGALDGTEPEFEQAMEKIVTAAHKHGKSVGTVAFGEDMVHRRAAGGVDFVVSGSDSSVLATGFQTQLAAAKKGVERPRL